KFPGIFPFVAIFSASSVISPELLLDHNRHYITRSPATRNRQCVRAGSYYCGKPDVELVRPDEAWRLPGVSHGGRIAVNEGLHVRAYVAPIVGRVRAQTRSEDRDEIRRSVGQPGVEWRRLECYGVHGRRGATAVTAQGENGGRCRPNPQGTR